MVAKKTTPTAAESKKTSAKPTKDETVPRVRLGIYQIIYETLKAHGGSLPLQRLEDECQKVKKESAGRYAAYAKTRFVNKDGNVLAEVSESGFKDALSYTQRRKLSVPHWVILKFPKEAAEYAKKLGLPMPKLENPAPVSSKPNGSVSKHLRADGNLASEGECPACREEKLTTRQNFQNLK
jgi:hypothetical protein